MIYCMRTYWRRIQQIVIIIIGISNAPTVIRSQMAISLPFCPTILTIIRYLKNIWYYTYVELVEDTCCFHMIINETLDTKILKKRKYFMAWQKNEAFVLYITNRTDAMNCFDLFVHIEKRQRQSVRQLFYNNNAFVQSDTWMRRRVSWPDARKKNLWQSTHMHDVSSLLSIKMNDDYSTLVVSFSTYIYTFIPHYFFLSFLSFLSLQRGKSWETSSYEREKAE